MHILNLLLLLCWPQKVKFSTKVQTFVFEPLKNPLGLKKNLKFNSPESVPRSVYNLTKPIVLISFPNFYGYPENAPNQILSSNLEEKIFKMVIKSEPLGLCSWNLGNFIFSMRLLNSENFTHFKIFDLTWIRWIWLELPSVDLDHFYWVTVDDCALAHIWKT